MIKARSAAAGGAGGVRERARRRPGARGEQKFHQTRWLLGGIRHPSQKEAMLQQRVAKSHSDSYSECKAAAAVAESGAQQSSAGAILPAVDASRAANLWEEVSFELKLRRDCLSLVTRRWRGAEKAEIKGEV